ncbi:mitochondrial fission ELM1 family protein [Methylocapsa sp. S129]|uniref:mitochondrial fission ELM1 family protein n=1 Tax=Methylocapsa sp. S129 TaxID=1641869 RepID=UPI001FED6B0B|nr:mitochondrial fission ELM1 family protein [Methylocapsa sp. S129]
MQSETLLAKGARVLVLSSGKAGHEANSLGVADALGAPYAVRNVAPRALFASLSPYGPVDPRDRPGRAGSVFARPFPHIVIASGRVTVPYIRAIKRAAGDKVFTVFLQDPRYSRANMDLIWAPEHDGLAGRNVISTLTSPHPFSAARLAAARAEPDPRVAILPSPRAAIILGGPSGAHDFAPADVARLTAAAAAIAAAGYSVMATPSRRTPPELVEAVRQGLGAAPAFVWDGTGANPYAQMLAHADAILVTGDSVNMVGEAAATGAPVHVLEPSGGGGGKIARYIDALERIGAVRRFAGRIERFSYEPIDSSLTIAREIARRFAASGAAPLLSAS